MLSDNPTGITSIERGCWAIATSDCQETAVSSMRTKICMCGTDLCNGASNPFVDGSVSSTTASSRAATVAQSASSTLSASSSTASSRAATVAQSGSSTLSASSSTASSTAATVAQSGSSTLSASSSTASSRAASVAQSASSTLLASSTTASSRAATTPFSSRTHALYRDIILIITCAIVFYST
jgi:hypothetical protein